MIPLPLRIAGFVLLGVLAFRVIGGALGSWMVILAVLLWLVVLLTLAYEFGWLNALTKLPGVAKFFGFMTNARAVQTAQGADSGTRGKLSDSDREKLFSEANARFSTLQGIEDTQEDVMDRLIAPAVDEPENPFGTQAPALVAVFAGPGGVGKTSVAIAAAQMLTGKNALETATVVTVRATDLRSGQFGSAAALGRAKAEQAVGGTLLIEDAAWLLDDDGYGGPGPASDFGQALLDVVTEHPQRIFIALTASAEVAAKLQRTADVSKWLSKLTTRVFGFSDLDDDVLVDLLEQRLGDAGWELESDQSVIQAKRLMNEVKDRAGMAFDNAESCRRVAEQLIEVVRSDANEELVRRRMIGRDAIRTLDDKLE